MHLTAQLIVVEIEPSEIGQLAKTRRDLALRLWRHRQKLSDTIAQLRSGINPLLAVTLTTRRGGVKYNNDIHSKSHE